MSPNKCVLPLTVLLLVPLTPLSAVGQIDYRVNQGNAGVAGRANDANPAVGGGGLNQSSSQFMPGGYAGAVITGNVTGLAGFHGFSPIPQANQFRLALPSADLATFNARSVGLNDVNANRTFGPGQYYDRQQTIASDLGFIRSGMNLPGSSQLASPNITPPSPAAPPPIIGLQQVPIATYQRVDQQINRNMWGFIRQDQAAPGTIPSAAPALSDWRYQSAAGSSIFGMPSLPSLEDLRALKEGKPLPAPGAAETTGQPQRAAEPGGAVGLIEGELTGLPTVQKAQPFAQDFGIQNRSLTGEQIAGPVADLRGVITQEPLAATQPPGKLGEDRFTDFFKAIQTAHQMGVRQLGFEAIGGEKAERAGPGIGIGGGAPKAEEPAAAPPAPRAVLRHPSTDALADLATAAKWANELIENPVTSFAGRYRNRLNQYMETGEEALRKGQYYHAAELFDVAHTIDPTNPLPLLDRGHALLAAGDYISAANALEQGIARFPQIAAFRIDLPAMGGPIYDIRRADLEKKLANSDQYELRFLLGYLELYSGLPEEGLRDLERAAKAAPPDSIVAIFADLVTNRRELPPLPGAEIPPPPTKPAQP